VFGVLGVAALLLAFLSWRYVEVPFRNRMKFSRGQIFSSAAVFSAAFISFGYYGHLNGGYPDRIDKATRAIEADDMRVFERQVERCWDSAKRDPTPAGACVFGDPAGARSFALLGDSHASAFLHGLSNEASRRHLKGRNFSYQRCPPMRSDGPVLPDEIDVACSRLRGSFYAALVRDPARMPDIVVMAARWTLLVERPRFDNGEGGIEYGQQWIWDLKPDGGSYGDLMRNNIVDSINRILAVGKTLILIYPVPEMGWNVPKYLAKRRLKAGKLEPSFGSTSYARYLERNRRAIAALGSLGERKNLVRIRPDRLLCDTYLKGRCVAHIDGRLLYFDDSHLNEFGVGLVVPEIISAIDR
jgi:hypothetical protein